MSSLVENTILLDEMESIEYTKLKPLTIPRVVDEKYPIKAIGVGKIPAKGHIQ